MLRIGGSVKHAFLQFLIHFLLLVLLGLEKSFDLLQVTSDRIGGIAEAEWNQIGVGHAHHCRSSELGKCAAIDELRIGKMRVPIKVIIDRVINASATFTTEAQVQRRHSRVIEKWSIVGAIA